MAPGIFCDPQFIMAPLSYSLLLQLFWSECDTHLSRTLSPQMEAKDYPFKSGLGLE